jgi:hypothetical protein
MILKAIETCSVLALMLFTCLRENVIKTIKTIKTVKTQNSKKNRHSERILHDEYWL